MRDVLYLLLDAIIKITRYFSPVIPIASEKVMEQIDDSELGVLRVSLSEEPLFPKIDFLKIGEFDVFEND